MIRCVPTIGGPATRTIFVITRTATGIGIGVPARLGPIAPPSVRAAGGLAGPLHWDPFGRVAAIILAKSMIVGRLPATLIQRARHESTVPDRVPGRLRAGAPAGRSGAATIVALVVGGLVTILAARPPILVLAVNALFPSLAAAPVRLVVAVPLGAPLAVTSTLIGVVARLDGAVGTRVPPRSIVRFVLGHTPVTAVPVDAGRRFRLVLAAAR
jgi:hypothetical protein